MRATTLLLLALTAGAGFPVVHAAAIPEPQAGAATSPEIPKVDPLDQLAGPPSSAFT